MCLTVLRLEPDKGPSFTRDSYQTRSVIILLIWFVSIDLISFGEIVL